MAGAEDNTDILAGMNQVIKAVNDLVLSATTTLNCGGCGTDPPSEPGEEGEDPPPGWENTDDPPSEPEYWTRKCKVANLTHESFLEWMELWKVYNVDDYVAGSLTVLVVLLGTLIGMLAFPVLGVVMGSILGFYGGLALIIIAGGFDLDALVALMIANEEDLVCSLYSSADAAGGKADYISVLQTAGASAGDVALLEAAIAIDAMNLLYFLRTEGKVAIEVALDGYSGPVDCAVCLTCPVPVYPFGSLIDEGAGYTEIAAELFATYYIIQIDFSADLTCFREMTSTVVLSGSVVPHPFFTPNIAQWYDGASWTFEDALIDLNGLCMSRLQVLSNVAFSIRLNYGDCP